MLAKNAVGACCCCEATKLKPCFYHRSDHQMYTKSCSKGDQTVCAFCFPSSSCQTLLVQVTPDDPPRNALFEAPLSCHTMYVLTLFFLRRQGHEGIYADTTQQGATQEIKSSQAPSLSCQALHLHNDKISITKDLYDNRQQSGLVQLAPISVH